jgi:hypothetical protein
MSSDPCDGRSQASIVRWYVQGGVRYPLRCGHGDPAGWGYLHIRDDEPRPGRSGPAISSWTRPSTWRSPTGSSGESRRRRAAATVQETGSVY